MSRRSPAPRRRERVYLAGFMGSGKSTIGPILANALGYGFVDIDRAIERAAGKSVSAIFREDGEEAFRSLERGLVAGLSTQPCIVVALGGGTVADPATLGLIRATGVLVYLKAAAEQILRRVARRSDRPMLLDPDGQPLTPADLRERVLRLYSLRAPVYELAELTILTDGRRVGSTVDELVRRLAPLLRPSP